MRLSFMALLDSFCGLLPYCLENHSFSASSLPPALTTECIQYLKFWYHNLQHMILLQSKDPFSWDNDGLWLPERWAQNRREEQSLTSWPVKCCPSCSTWACSRSCCSRSTSASRLWLTSCNSCTSISDCSWICRASRGRGAGRLSSGGFSVSPAFCTSFAR